MEIIGIRAGEFSGKGMFITAPATSRVSLPDGPQHASEKGRGAALISQIAAHYLCGLRGYRATESQSRHIQDQWP